MPDVAKSVLGALLSLRFSVLHYRYHTVPVDVKVERHCGRDIFAPSCHFILFVYLRAGLEEARDWRVLNLEVYGGRPQVVFPHIATGDAMCNNAVDNIAQLAWKVEQMRRRAHDVGIRVE